MRFADHSAAPYILGVWLVSSLLLYISRDLDFLFLDYAFEVKTNYQSNQKVWIEREVGFFLAINWTVFFMVFMPALIFIFHGVVSETRRFFERLNINRMLVYIDEDGKEHPAETGKIWNHIAKVSARFMLVIFIVIFLVGLLQWYRFSGDWYFTDFDLKQFEAVSTGVDWNVAWAVEEMSSTRALLITLFALFCYLYYGVGWVFLIGFYIYVFIFFLELYRITHAIEGPGQHILRINSEDAGYGGFQALLRIQRWHAWFCGISIANMFTMSLRNNYLPPYCNAPEFLHQQAGGAFTKHCTNIIDFLFIGWNYISRIPEDILGYLRDNALQILFFQYVRQNDFTIGPFFHTLLIAGFFIIVSEAMRKSIVLAARNSNSEEKCARALRHLKKTNLFTMIAILMGAIGTIFLNIGSLVIVFVVVWLAYRMVSRTIAALKFWET